MIALRLSGCRSTARYSFRRLRKCSVKNATVPDSGANQHHTRNSGEIRLLLRSKIEGWGHEAGRCTQGLRLSRFLLRHVGFYGKMASALAASGETLEKFKSPWGRFCLSASTRFETSPSIPLKQILFKIEFFCFRSPLSISNSIMIRSDSIEGVEGTRLKKVWTGVRGYPDFERLNAGDPVRSSAVVYAAWWIRSKLF